MYLHLAVFLAQSSVHSLQIAKNDPPTGNSHLLSESPLLIKTFSDNGEKRTVIVSSCIN